jgi:predicted ATP-binding protein involved in virulence
MPRKKNNSNNSEKSQNAYFLSLELENVRCFGERQKIDFSDGKNKLRQWTIILGDNGTGKTTILQSLVAITPFEHSSDKSIFPLCFNRFNKSLLDWLPFRHKDFRPNIAVTLQKRFHLKSSLINEYSYEVLGNRSSVENYKYWNETNAVDIFNIKINCFAYGASRKAGETSLSEQNEESAYKTLFDETALLVNPEEWLLQADYFVSRSSAKKSKEKFRQVKEVLISVLPDVDNIKISEMNNKEKSFPIPIVEFHTPYGWVESKDLSLGYRTSMAWTVDFASRMFDLYPESENPLAEPAVVLIDEIDLHLHPKWQRELIDYLTNLFPNTQFIVTTHSPLIVQAAAARDANIVVCRCEGDHIVIDQSVEAVKNWRADQILTSDLFGLETARPKKIEPFLEERQEILSKAKLSKKDEQRLQELENQIGFMPVSENPEDDKAMDIIRRAAKRLQSEAK